MIHIRAMKLSVGDIRIFHACMVTSSGLTALAYMESFTSPIEDEMLRKGILTEDVYPLFESSLLLGGIVGTSIAGPFCEWIGVKSALILTSPLALLGSALLVWAHDPASMIVSRFLIGFFSGLSASCIPVYNAEISTIQMKAFYGSILGVSLKAGLKMDPNKASTLYSVFVLLGSVSFLWIIRKVHWKKLILFTTSIQLISNALLATTFYLSIDIYRCSDNQQSTLICDILQFAPLPLVSSFAFAMALGCGSIGYYLIGEILHHHYTRISSGIVLFTAYTSSYLNILVAPYLVDHLGAPAVFMGYAIVCLVCVFIQCLY